MKVIKIFHYALTPHQSRGPLILNPEVDPTPKPSTIQIEFTHAEYLNLTRCLYRAKGDEELDRNLLGEMFIAAIDAGLDYTEGQYEVEEPDL